MASSLEVVTAGPADRLPLYRMLELYQHDLSDIWDQELDIHGDIIAYMRGKDEFVKAVLTEARRWSTLAYEEAYRDV